MHKAITPLVAAALAMTVLAGCRGNVSERPDGMVTEPGATPATSATMPGTDTAPINPLPPTSTEQTTDPTGETKQEDTTTGPSGTRGRRAPAKHTNPGAPTHRS